jgi:transcriptional regulator with XRE-family HTH domain
MLDIISKENIGNRLKQLRKSHGLSQTEFASKIGLTRGNYAQIEMGKQFPAYEVLIGVSKEFKKSYEWILHGFDVSEITTELTRELRSDIGNVPENRSTESDWSHSFKTVDRTDKCFVIRQTQYLDYIANLSNENFLDQLPIFSHPLGIPSNSGSRAFEIQDEQMGNTLQRSDIAICKPLTTLSEVKKSGIYILVTSNSIKTLRFHFLSKDKNFVGSTDQKIFKPIAVPVSNIIQLWEVTGRLTTALGNGVQTDHISEMAASLLEIRFEVDKLSTTD